VADYVFVGRILPEDSDVSLKHPIIIGAQEITSHCVFETSISIEHSHISIEVTVNTGQIDVLTLRNSVRNIVRTITDSIGFVHVMALDLEMNAVIDAQGNRTTYDNSTSRTPCLNPCAARKFLFRMPEIRFYAPPLPHLCAHPEKNRVRFS